MAAEQMELAIPAARPRVRLTDEEVADRTSWSDAVPPCSGFWEVQRVSGEPEDAGRWWFVKGDHAGMWLWSPSGDLVHGVRVRIMHNTFVAMHRWRGLVAPARGVYPCPPYSSGDLVPRAQAAGHPLRTTYVSIAPLPRRRVRL